MLFSKVLYVLGLLPKSAQLTILITLTVIAILAIRKKLFSFTSLSSISIILIIHIIEKLIFFIFLVEINDYELFINVILQIAVLFIIGYQSGTFCVVMYIFGMLFIHFYPTALNSKLIIVYIILVILLMFIACLQVKEFLKLTWLEILIYLLIYGRLQIYLTSIIPIELTILMYSLMKLIKESKFMGIAQWLVSILCGFVVFYLIDFAFCHIWIFIILFIFLNSIF